jgi:predicted N-acetyltransferase YhbS
MNVERRTSLTDAQVEDLHRLYQNEWWTRGRYLEDVQRMVRHSDLLFALVAPDTQRLLAFVRVLSDRVFKAMIFDLIVDPEHRNEGLGRRIMDWIREAPELTAVKHFELYCLPEMIPYYERLGFTTDVGGIYMMRRMGGGQ